MNNTLLLCEALDNPQHKFKSIHVGGTNGKGSSSHMIAAILQSQGYKTGLYTSPHLKEFTERIKINGVEIEAEYLVSFVKKIKPVIEKIKPSFFEITVALAFDYFAHQKVDFAVIEVGLGGRLDSTNVINPLVSLITNIGFDHKDLLGDTLSAIASEKAGIIKNKGRAVISERQSNIESVFIEKANQMNSSLQFAEDEYKVERHGDHGFRVLKAGQILFENLQPELLGGYQKKNIAGVLSTIDELRLLGVVISDESLKKGIELTITLTGLKGRWQKLGVSPLIYTDTAHNQDGIREVLQMIDSLTFHKLHIVLGVVKDKDAGAVLSLLPRGAFYYFCSAKIPRALDVEALAAKAIEFGLKGNTSESVEAAISKAKTAASPDDLIFIGGSTFVVAEIPDL
ncbi:MAG: folylpolyglutamate synthase/dihydrofolate synthase family protein [Cyclobacteriaceae bacterium]